MKNFIAILVLLGFPIIALGDAPSHCSDSEQVVFSCKIERSSKVLSLCASKQLTSKTGYLQYRFGTPGKVELEFPNEKQDSQSRFLYAHYFRYQVERVQASFKNNDHEYTVFDYYDSSEKPPRTAGVSVGQTELYCGGSINSRLSSLKDVIACDEESALNMISCNQ